MISLALGKELSRQLQGRLPPCGVPPGAPDRALGALHTATALVSKSKPSGVSGWLVPDCNVREKLSRWENPSPGVAPQTLPSLTTETVLVQSKSNRPQRQSLVRIMALRVHP